MHTPKHGRWLNRAECELRVLEKQCLGDRIADPATLDLPDLRRILKLKKVPHDSPLKNAHDRLLKKRLSIPSLMRFSAWLVKAA